MAKAFKPKVSTYALKDGSYYTAAGDRVTKDTPGAVKITKESQVYYGKYRNKDGKRVCVPLCTHKKASDEMLAKLITDAKMRSLGLGDPFEAHRRRPLIDHLEDFERALHARAATKKHARQTAKRVRELIEGCRFLFLADVQPSRAADWLASKRKAGELSAATSNYYLREARSFFAWMVKDGRIGSNPLQVLAPIKSEKKVTRRTLSEGEFAELIAAASKGKPVRNVSGPDRAILYLVAVETGLRASELASLTPESFDLAGDRPTVTVEAAYSKRRRQDVQPLRAGLVDRLRPWLAGKPARCLLWPGGPGGWANHAAKLIREDLRALNEARRQGDKKAAEVPYRDRRGLVFDFHALRHQFVSNLAAAGVAPKVAQTLARHSTITLTMDRYTHLGASDTREALDRLPELPNGKAAPASNARGQENRVAGSQADRAADAPRPRLDHFFRTDTNGNGQRPKGRGNKKRPQLATAEHFRTDSDDSGQEAPPGFEPGMADLQSAAETGATLLPFNALRQDADTRLGRASTISDPNLAQLCEAWHSLPEAIRAGILAMVKVAGPSSQGQAMTG